MNQQDYDADDPTDPRHPDHDLSTAAQYGFDEPYKKPWFLRRWLLLIVAVVVVVSLVLPYILRI